MVDWGRGSNYTGKARKEKIKERKWNQKKRERKREGEALKSCGEEKNKEGEE